MAKMYPEYPPSYIFPKGKQSAEKTLFDAFQKELSDDYSVLYSVEWLASANNHIESMYIDPIFQNRSPGMTALGEIDFVIIHPKRGILAVEAKGGYIYVSKGKWFSQSLGNQKYYIKDPIRQARKNSFALRDHLNRLSLSNVYSPFIYYSAFFPDTKRTKLNYGIAVIPEMMGFKEDITNIQTWIDNAYSAWETLLTSVDRSKQAYFLPSLNKQDIAQIIAGLAPTVQAYSPFSNTLIAQHSREIHELTSEQYHLLKMLSKTNRAYISGASGTGKTLLAYEKAKQLALQGYRTLFTCPNRLVADLLRSRPDTPQNLVTKHFHGLGYELSQEIGLSHLPDPDAPGRESLPGVYFDVVLPLALAHATERLGRYYEAIVVDEGQDMAEHLWEILADLLVNPAEGIFWIFYDPHQTVWYHDSLPKWEGARVALNRNMRNASEICQLLNALHQSEECEALGPGGGIVDFHETSGDDPVSLCKSVSALIQKLQTKHKIMPQEIAIISGRRKTESAFTIARDSCSLTINEEALPQKSAVQFSSIRRFRGLERSIIILVEIDDLVEQITSGNDMNTGTMTRPASVARDTLYIGLGRAQSALHIFGNGATIGYFKTLVNSENAD